MDKHQEAITKCIDRLFPEGDSRRGDALCLQAVAFVEGKRSLKLNDELDS